jgi:tetratricopeptide (TPR) repeat protein
MKLAEHVRNLTPDEVDCIIDDLRLLDAGYRLNLCVDPYEIFDFCIPLNPESSDGRDIDIIADDQASLYHAFFNWGRKPILVPEYRTELERLIRYFEHAVGEGYSRQNLVNALLREAREAPHARNAVERLHILEQDFSVVLAVTMGIYSVGIDRLREVIHDRLSSAPAELTLEEEWNRADDGNLKAIIHSSLVGDLQRLLDKGGIDESDFARRKRSAETDAIVISRLIRMNAREPVVSRRESRSKDSKDSKDIFLYVSSAPRSRRIFGLPAIVDAQPEINRQPFTMWRTRAQLFIYSLHNVTYNTYDRSLDPISYLTRLKPILAETRHFPHMKQCHNCVLNGGNGDRDCKLVKLCDMISSLDYGITTARKSMRNLALLKSLENYERFKDAKPKKKEESAYIEFFRGLFEDRVPNVVLERIRELQRMVLIKWEFSENMPAMMYSVGREIIKKTHVDSVTNPIQALPIHLRLTSADHRGIVDAVIQFHKTPDVGTVGVLDRAYKTFVESDRQDSSLHDEHEVVRCFLYMACIGSENEQLRISGNALAVRHAETLEEENKRADRADLWYVKAWALRRSGQYQVAEKLLNRAIRRYPSDPRMWHGRCINTFAWYQDREKEPFTPKLSRAVSDAVKAIPLYKKENAVEQCAVNWNNIAYLRSFEPSVPIFNLKAARIALNSLKNVMPRDDWFPKYPEFFHTEAMLEFREYRTEADRPITRFDLIEKLTNASKVIARAIAVEEKPSYVDLREKIDRALEQERERAATHRSEAAPPKRRARTATQTTP